MTQRLDPERLLELTQAENLEALPSATIVDLFRAETALAAQLPNGEYAVDPRNGDRVLFSPARARRPHLTAQPHAQTDPDPRSCPICAGETTGILDSVELSEGTTFINKNLYPMLYPFELAPARGLHLLQWTSSYHDVDWHNLPAADRPLVMGQLAQIERKFIEEPPRGLVSEEGTTYVSIIKNVGASVGASLTHGHQQIAIGNIPPGRTLENRRFVDDFGHTFSQALLADLDPDWIVRDYGTATLLVPAFMKRPHEMILAIHDPDKSYLHQLSQSELRDFSDGWHDACRAFQHLMPSMGMKIAFNVVVSNGPGAGLYAEFLPRTQATGGFERMDLYVCQSTPQMSASDLRDSLDH